LKAEDGVRQLDAENEAMPKFDISDRLTKRKNSKTFLLDNVNKVKRPHGQLSSSSPVSEKKSSLQPDLVPTLSFAVEDENHGANLSYSSPELGDRFSSM